MLLKGNLAQKSWPIDAVVGADCRGRGSDSLGRLRGSRIGGEFLLDFASKEATITLDRGHDQLAIGPRSWTFLLPSLAGTVRRVLEESWH